MADARTVAASEADNLELLAHSRRDRRGGAFGVVRTYLCAKEYRAYRLVVIAQMAFRGGAQLGSAHPSSKLTHARLAAANWPVADSESLFAPVVAGRWTGFTSSRIYFIITARRPKRSYLRSP